MLFSICTHSYWVVRYASFENRPRFINRGLFSCFSRKFKFINFVWKKISHAITLIGIWAWGVPIACLFYAACLIESSHAGHPSHGPRIARLNPHFQKMRFFIFLIESECFLKWCEMAAIMPWISPHWREACFHGPSLTETCVSVSRTYVPETQDQVSGKSRSGRTCVLKVMSRLVIPENNGISWNFGVFR